VSVMTLTNPEKYFTAPREEDQRRSVKGDERKTFEVSEMWEMHHEIVRLLVLGMSNVDICKILGVSQPMVSYTRNSKVVKDKLAIMRAARDADTIDIAKDIQAKAPKALALLYDIIEDHGETYGMPLAAKTAESWLDRAGHAPIKSVQFAGMVAHLTAEEITSLKKSARDEAEAANLIVDVTPEESNG